MNNVMEWTTFNLMTDTAVLEQNRVADEIKSIILQLERKLDAIIEREDLAMADSMKLCRD